MEDDWLFIVLVRLELRTLQDAFVLKSRQK